MRPDPRRALPEEVEQSVCVPEPQLQAILCAVRELRFGAVEIIVQDGKIIQINKTEKIRF